jgi:ATP-dependent DNA helicase RecQ
VNKAVRHEMVANYRSKNNLVEFSNQFVKQIRRRLKNTPIIARQTDNGRIKLVRYQSDNLIVPLVHDILATALSGTTCVLTKTNEEALQITGMLLKNKIPAKLIQTNDGFNLYNLSEVRYFLSRLDLADDVFTISDDVWANAARELESRFRNSTKLETCSNIIREFEATNPKKKYKSDLDAFIRESRLEDFISANGETIFVSTIHKAKGKEFDNVFLMLQDFNPATDDAKRQLYVAMTRAKKYLIVHLNSNFLDRISVENIEHLEDKGMYLPPNEMAMNLTFKDVWLDYFINKQHLVSQLTSGDTLIINGNECLNSKGQSVLKFSQQFAKQIDKMKKMHYELKSAKVNFVLYWLKEGSESEVKIVLPELNFVLP